MKNIMGSNLRKIFVALVAASFSAATFAVNSTTSTKDDFNHNWTFWSASNNKKVTVNLPHDAMQTEQRQPKMEGGHHSGYFPGGVYHYEKVFDATPSMREGHVAIHFGGVYRNATVYLNNKKLLTHYYGYSPFEVSLDGHLNKGRNVVRVDVDNSKTPNSRWYSGSGIYRPVRLIVENKIHIDDVKIKTLSIDPAIVNFTVSKKQGEVEIKVMDGSNEVASAKGPNADITIPNPKLWSADSPYLYRAVVTLKDKNQTVDTKTYDFGIRQISWSHDHGLMVNGKTVKLRGGCIHHDNGIIGAAEYDGAAMRKVAIMKQYGFNAIRSAHNPCSEALLKACDKLGMYILDEFADMWFNCKTAYDYGLYFKDNYESDIQSMIDKDYNHPSVIMYSIGNEPTEPGTDKGVEIAEKLVDRFHKLDNTRPVTCGINMTILYYTKRMGSTTIYGKDNKKDEQPVSSEQFNEQAAKGWEMMMRSVTQPAVDSAATPVFDLLDIAGYNYATPRYEIDGKDHPKRIDLGTESYPFMLSENWALVEKLPYLVGDFMWTAWDHLGEAGLGAWYYSNEPPTPRKLYPWLLSGAGAIDLIGHPTGEALLAKAVWLNDGNPYIAVRPLDNRQLIKAAWRGTNSIPSWSWKGCEGMDATVEVYTSAKKVDLYLNGNSIATSPVKDYVATFKVKYAPGVLRAVATDDKNIEREASLVSADSNLRIAVTPHRWGDLIYADIDLVGQNGQVESKADTKLSVKVSGGDLLGFGSAQPCTEERFNTGSYTTYYGRSQAIIRPTSGTLTISVSGSGLPACTKVIENE